MKVTFVGNGKNDPKTITAYGVEFILGEPVEVDIPEQFARKIKNNPHFEVEHGNTSKNTPKSSAKTKNSK